MDIQSQDDAIRAASLEFVERHASDPGVWLVSLDDILCPEGNPCPAAIDGQEIRLQGNDQTHFSELGAAFVAPLLLDQIEAGWTNWQATG